MPEGFYVQQDGPVTIHVFTASTDSAVDCWEEAVIEQVETTPPDQPFRMLMDVSAHKVDFTRYARQKSVSLFTRYRHRHGRIAFLFSSRTAPHFARIFFATLGKLTFEHRYYSSREQALEWLHDRLSERNGL